MELVTDINLANCITHSGTMHADEIFSTAFLDLYLGEAKVFRTSSVPKKIKETALVYDIGLGKYDHHQENAQRRSNNIPYCSFGLLWQSFGRTYLESKSIDEVEEVFTMFDQDFVEAIDADDNGIFPKIESPYKVKTLSEVFKLFNPGYKSGQEENTQFQKAVFFAKEIFEEELISVIGKVKAKKRVLEQITKKENHTLYLDEYMPYEQVLLSDDTSSDIYFVVFPSNRGGYAIKTVPISLENHNKRLDFPKSWAGLTGKELEDKAGIKGLSFCHSTCFLVTCNSKETAKLVIDKVLAEKTNSEIDCKDSCLKDTK